jgi:hypothetical protein
VNNSSNFGCAAAHDTESIENMKPFLWSLLVGLMSFVVAYVVLVGVAMIRFSYFSGPLPDLLYAIPVPFFVAACAGAIAYRVRYSN